MQFQAKRPLQLHREDNRTPAPDWGTNKVCPQVREGKWWEQFKNCLQRYIGPLSTPEKRRLETLATKSKKALWFTECFRLQLDSLQLTDSQGQKYALKISPDSDVSPTAKQIPPPPLSPPVTPTHLLHPHRASKSSPPPHGSSTAAYLTRTSARWKQYCFSWTRFLLGMPLFTNWACLNPTSSNSVGTS